MPKTKLEFFKGQLTNFVFTLNNYTMLEELDLLCTGLPITYIIYGYEVGKTGTPHLQGYAELNHKMRIQTIKKLGVGFERMHIEPRQGKQLEAIKYCKKDGQWMEFGEPKQLKQGQRNDLDQCREAARDHGMKEVSCWGNLQEIRIAEKYLQYNEPKRNWKPEVTWLYGLTGTGKSKLAHQMLPNAYTKSEGSKWWDGYDAHDTVILDDFRGDWMKLSELLTLLDRYERRVEYKGGTRQFLAKKIIITSCKSPQECYNVPDENIDQLLRRLDCVKHLGGVTEVGGNTVNPDSHHIEVVI